MTTYAEYFAREKYQARYFLGDRVSGIYLGIPFVGTVAVDRMLDEYIGAQVVVLLDLPMRVADTVRTMVTVTHEDLKPLREFA